MNSSTIDMNQVNVSIIHPDDEQCLDADGMPVIENTYDGDHQPAMLSGIETDHGDIVQDQFG